MFNSDLEKKGVEIINFKIVLLLFDSVFVEERNFKGILEEFLFEVEDFIFGII